MAVNTSENMRCARLVLAEDGTKAFDACLVPAACEETVVVRQAGSEPHGAWVYRALQRIAALERSGCRVTCALILAARRSDVVSMEGRELLSRAFLTHAADSPAGSSELTISCEADGDLRHELLALVGRLVSERRKGSVPVRAVFATPTPLSGVCRGGVSCEAPRLWSARHVAAS